MLTTSKYSHTQGSGYSNGKPASTHRDPCTLVGSIYGKAHVLELDSMACTRRGTYLLCLRVESTCPSAGMGSCAWHLVSVCVYTVCLRSY